ncbi:MAG: nuclear transport factor 2 family protein [Cyclobacteriaceae bacterium]|nr:nuclear transport factor 2 family protein [Cyclobacteriaceae bacterium]UYN88550.1 MAG: nuclear transport factor 2 family protein [Cyclobacteriaceae bacterium]
MLTDDVLITTGNGTLIQGKENLKTYISKASGPKMYWVRTPIEIEVNNKLGLAWETGTWKGYSESGEKSVTGGKYSAHWSKIEGVWKIKSQLFVTLE